MRRLLQLLRLLLLDDWEQPEVRPVKLRKTILL